MRHIKKFNESTEIHKKIWDEVMSIKYLLEDEGYKLSCFPGKIGFTEDATLIVIDYESSDMWDTYKQINKLVLRGESAHRAPIWAPRVVQQPEYYLEFIDRLEEFCNDNKLRIEIFNNFAKEYSRHIKTDTLIIRISKKVI